MVVLSSHGSNIDFSCAIFASICLSMSVQYRYPTKTYIYIFKYIPLCLLPQWVVPVLKFCGFTFLLFLLNKIRCNDKYSSCQNSLLTAEWKLILDDAKVFASNHGTEPAFTLERQKTVKRMPAEMARDERIRVSGRRKEPDHDGWRIHTCAVLYSLYPTRGGATVLKVGGTILRAERVKKFFLTPHFLASEGDKILLR